MRQGPADAHMPHGAPNAATAYSGHTLGWHAHKCQNRPPFSLSPLFPSVTNRSGKRWLPTYTVSSIYLTDDIKTKKKKKKHQHQQHLLLHHLQHLQHQKTCKYYLAAI